MHVVSFYDTRISADPLELQVADNGAGLTDITKALILFSSTKSGHGLTKGECVRDNLIHDVRRGGMSCMVGAQTTTIWRGRTRGATSVEHG